MIFQMPFKNAFINEDLKNLVEALAKQLKFLLKNSLIF